MARQSPQKNTVRISCDLRFLRYLPEGYRADGRKKWPLVLFLHGSGERGNDLKKLKHHGLPKLIEQGHDYPFVVISPQCPAGEHWNALVLEGLIEQMARRLRIDRKRIYLTGLSMGGFGVWELATRNPGRYAAVIPICGGGETLFAPTLRDLPLWAFHGANDQVVPLKRSKEMIDAIKAAGGSPRFTVYSRTGHDSWTKTYENPEVYEWLLAQRRRAPGKATGLWNAGR